MSNRFTRVASTVRRVLHVHELVLGGVAVEQLVRSADEHVAAREHDAVVLGQAAATLADRVGAQHLARARVEHQVAPRRLAERLRAAAEKPLIEAAKLDPGKPVSLLVKDENGQRFITFRPEVG